MKIPPLLRFYLFIVFAFPAIALASNYVSLKNNQGQVIEAKLLKLAEGQVKFEPRGDYRTYTYPLTDLDTETQKKVEKHFSRSDRRQAEIDSEAEQKRKRRKRYDINLIENFKDWDLEPRKQGYRGTCSIFAISHLLDYTLARAGIEDVTSPEFLNWSADRVDNHKIDGAFFHHALEGIETYGFVMEQDLPYRSTYDPDWEPDEELLAVAAQNRSLLTDSLQFKVHWIRPWKNATRGLSEEVLDKIIGALGEGFPVGIGGTHSLCILGYEGRGGDDQRGTFHAVDSAGGYFKELDYDYMSTEAIEVFYIEIATDVSVQPVRL